MDPVNYVHADGRDRVVASVDSAVNARADGFYDPDSPSGKRITKLRAEQARVEGGTPSESWTHDELDAYAATHAVEVSGTKAEKVAALTSDA